MACFNKNTAEYKALKEEFGKDIMVDAAIINYQRSTNSNIIPSLAQVNQARSDMRVMGTGLRSQLVSCRSFRMAADQRRSCSILM